MNKMNRPLALVVMLGFAPIALASGTFTPTVFAEGEFQGHYYRVFSTGVGDPGSDQSAEEAWNAASAAAQSSTFMGVPGHLATITSAAEDAFVESLREGLFPAEAWIGGFQDVSSCGPNPDPGCGWMWVNGEGAISTPQVPLLSYSNWLAGEPNNLGGEQFLAIGLNGNFGWNDEQEVRNVGGYVVEYDVPIPAEECVSGSDGCAISEGSTLTFPDTAELTQMAAIDVRRFEFTDDLELCGTTPRLLFGPATDPDDEIPDAIVPAYLCGSPKFLVVAAETTGVQIPEGTILVENQASDVFPDNLYDCQGPLDPDLLMPPGDPNNDVRDPQNRDVMAWQTTDLTKMLENDLGGVNDFAGSVGEFTFECGSSRGKTNTASYFFIGLHIDFGPGTEFSVNPALNHDRFVALTRYKLVLLEAAVLESEVALNGTTAQMVGFKKLKKLVKKAIRFHDRGKYEQALRTLGRFETVVEGLDYDPIQGENYNGEHLQRVSNAQFMYTDKVIPNAP